MIDNELIMSFDINYINESKIIDGFWNIVDKLAEKIINLLRKLRLQIREFRKESSLKRLNNKLKKIDLEKIKADFDYYIPNKQSIQLYLNSIYTESYNGIVMKSIMMANQGKTKEMYIELFGKYPCDTYSDNNNYLLGISNYLSRVFKRECKDKEDLNKCLSYIMSDRSTIRFLKTSQIKAELKSSNGDLYSTQLGKDLKLISDIKEWTIEYFTNVTNKIMVDVNKMKSMINKNCNNYDSETKIALVRLLQHYTRLIRDSNIYGAIKSIDDMENRILNKFKTDDERSDN